MTYNVLMGTLNPTHSLTHSQLYVLCKVDIRSSTAFVVVPRGTTIFIEVFDLSINFGLFGVDDNHTFKCCCRLNA